MPKEATLAAGGVVYRLDGRNVEVAVVHRPRYDDWSLPKGKLEPGETSLAAAVREVGEETGAKVAVTRRLRGARYRHNGSPKQVFYWAMRFLGGAFEASSEVDRVAWLAPQRARRRLSYGADVKVLDDFVALPQPEATVVLVRHAKAGKRTKWRGEDTLRPLDADGQRQARALGQTLCYFAPRRIIAADRARCIQTVEPLGERLDLPVQVDDRFNDESFVLGPDRTLDVLLSLGKPDESSVVCSQGIAIPALIDRICTDQVDSATRKGAYWVLTFVDGTVLSVDHYDAP